MFTPCPLHPRRPGLVLPGPVHELGVVGPTRGQARGRAVRRTSRGYYLPARFSDDDAVEQRIVEASVLVPAGSAITGWAALRWLGGTWFTGTTAGARLPVPIISGTLDRRSQAGIVRSGEGLKRRHVHWVDDVPVTDAVFSVSWQMRRARSLAEAVQVLEMACFDDLVTIDEVDGFLTPGQNGWTGVPLARRAVPYAGENSWSPGESTMKWVWEQAGHGPVLANAPIFDQDGRHLLTPDLLDPVAGVVGEYDGAAHLDRAGRDHDIRREAAVRDLGLESVAMTGADLRDTSHFTTRLHQAYHRAASTPRSDRWTVDAPPWWVPTGTVAQRRALDDGQRRRLLRYRRTPEGDSP